MVEHTENGEEPNLKGKASEKEAGTESNPASQTGTEDGGAELETTEDWESKYKKSQDEYLRLYAEFDNFRRRTNKERLELTQTASAGVIREILPVLDDFERAIANMSDAGDINAVVEGITIIYKKLQGVLKSQGVEEIEALGESFNPDLHEALTHIPAANDAQKGCVVDVVEKGYKVKDKIIRHPKVVVGS